MRIIKSMDSSGRTVWHLLDARGDWVQSFALRREAKAAMAEIQESDAAAALAALDAQTAKDLSTGEAR